jgi:hypothetical protein
MEYLRIKLCSDGSAEVSLLGSGGSSSGSLFSSLCSGGFFSGLGSSGGSSSSSGSLLSSLGSGFFSVSEKFQFRVKKSQNWFIVDSLLGGSFSQSEREKYFSHASHSGKSDQVTWQLQLLGPSWPRLPWPLQLICNDKV